MSINRTLHRARYVYHVGQRRMGLVRYIAAQSTLVVLIAGSALLPAVLGSSAAHALAAGGDTSVVDPDTEEPISILENSREPEAPNIRVIVPSLTDNEDYTYLQVLSVTGGTLKDSDGNTITLGEDNNYEAVFNGRIDFWFTPAANRNTDASFTYRLINYEDFDDVSDVSTVTIPITPVDVAPTLTTTNGWTGTGLTGTYYRTDYDLTGDTTTRVDPTIDFDTSVEGVCGQTVWDIENVCPDNFSVRWTGQVKAPTDGDYSFTTTSDDGVRLWVDGQPLVDNWTTHGPETDYSLTTLHFAAGSTHDIELDYYERGGGELIDLQWAHDTDLEDYEDIPTEDLYPGTIRPELTYVVGSPAVAADDGLSIGDVDSTTMSGATAQIIDNYYSSEDSLQFTNQHGISGSYDSSNGTLTLDGTASVADYQTALRSVKYYNGSTEPHTDTRTLQFMVNDGEKDSNVTTRDIAFSTENSPPEILEGTSTDVTMDEDSDPTPFDLTLDDDDPNFDPITWSITTAAGHGNSSVDTSGNTVVAHYTPHLHYSGSDSFTVQASDGQGGHDTIVVHVTITPFSDTDGVDTPTEDAAPNSGDANHDGILDSKQSNVAAFVSSATNHYVGIAVDDSCILSDTNVQSQTVAGGTDAGYSYPLGLASFTANCGADGFTTIVTQYYYNPPVGDYVARKVVGGTYQTIPGATVSRQNIGGQPVLVVSYEITDGGPLDADGEANGIIVDPVGPAIEAMAPTPTGDNNHSLTDTGVNILATMTLAASLLVTATIVRGRNLRHYHK